MEAEAASEATHSPHKRFANAKNAHIGWFWWFRGNQSGFHGAKKQANGWTKSVGAGWAGSYREKPESKD